MALLKGKILYPENFGKPSNYMGAAMDSSMCDRMCSMLGLNVRKLKLWRG